MTRKLPPADIRQAVYESSASGNRVVLVDGNANQISTTNPLPVDTAAEQGRDIDGHGQTLVTNSATLIVDGNPNRKGVQVFWSGLGVDLYVGSGTNVDTTSNGYLLYDQEWMTLPTTGSVYGITASNSGSAFYIEV